MEITQSRNGAAQRIAGGRHLVAGEPERALEAGHAAHGASQPVSPWLTTQEACDYLRYTGRNRLRSLYRFIERTGVNVQRRGLRSLLLKRTDLDAAIGVHASQATRQRSSDATRKR